jgi:hypothetical protein
LIERVQVVGFAMRIPGGSCSAAGKHTGADAGMPEIPSPSGAEPAVADPAL